MKTTKTQTAVEWLVEKIKIKYDIDFYHIKKEINQAKEMEKQQIINAYVNNRYIDNSIPIKKDDAIKYFTETYDN